VHGKNPPCDADVAEIVELVSLGLKDWFLFCKVQADKATQRLFILGFLKAGVDFYLTTSTLD